MFHITARTEQAEQRMTWGMRLLVNALVLLPCALTFAGSVAEISPTEVSLSAGTTDFTYDLLVSGVSPVDRVTVSVPGSFSGASLTSVKVNGVPAGYTDESSGNSLAFLLTSPAADGSSLQIGFQAAPFRPSGGLSGHLDPGLHRRRHPPRFHGAGKRRRRRVRREFLDRHGGPRHGRRLRRLERSEPVPRPE